MGRDAEDNQRVGGGWGGGRHNKEKEGPVIRQRHTCWGAGATGQMIGKKKKARTFSTVDRTVQKDNPGRGLKPREGGGGGRRGGRTKS